MSKKLLCIIIFFFCGLCVQAGNSLGFSKQKPLIFGLDTDYAPLEYVDEDGMPKGYDVEFAQEYLRRCDDRTGRPGYDGLFSLS